MFPRIILHIKSFAIPGKVSLSVRYTKPFYILGKVCGNLDSMRCMYIGYVILEMLLQGYLSSVSKVYLMINWLSFTEDLPGLISERLILIPTRMTMDAERMTAPILLTA